MNLTRTIERELGDGNSIIVDRTWQVAFVEANFGWYVNGSQVAVQVAAPAELAPLAEIERNRATPEAFPVRLDRQGMILASKNRASGVDTKQLLSAADQVLVKRGAGAAERQALQAFIAQLQHAASGMLTDFPEDLFFPSGEPRSFHQELELGDGLKGEFEMIYSSNVQDGSRLLARSERIVTTRIAGTEMRSFERWKLDRV